MLKLCNHEIVLRCGFIGALWIALAGCASHNGALEKQVRDLQSEISRMHAQRANFEAHTTSLDDEIVVLKKKLEVCRQSGKPEMKVIRLSASAEDAAPSNPAGETDETPIQAQTQTQPRTRTRPKANKSQDEPRPNIVLDETRFHAAQRFPAVRSSSLQTSGFADLPTDDLGVVSADPNPGSMDQAAWPADPGAGGVDPMDAFHTAYQDYAAERFDEALESFSIFVRDNPNHPYADNAVFWRAKCYLAKGNYPRAIGEFDRLVRRYPSSEKVASALYSIGFIYDELHDRAKALEYYFQVVEKYPESEAAKRASSRVGALENKERSIGLTPTAAQR